MDGPKCDCICLSFEDRDVMSNRENKESAKSPVRSHGMLASELQ